MIGTAILPAQAAYNGLYIFGDGLSTTNDNTSGLADVAQPLISPVLIGGITASNGSNQLVVTNMPIGLNGFVDAATNLALNNWTSLTNIMGSNIVESVFIGNSGPLQFYRLRFPYAWYFP